MSLQKVTPDSTETAIPASTKRVGGVRRRTAARRAGLAVLSGLAAIAVLQIVAAAALELWAPGMIDPDYGARLQRLRQGCAADPAHTCVVVALGSSRTQSGLDAFGLEGSLSRELQRPVCVSNFATPGGGPMRELITWRRLCHDGVRPDLLLVEVMPCFLGEDFLAAEAGERLTPMNRLRLLDLPVIEKYQPEARPHLRRDALLARLNTLYSHRAGILYTAAPRLEPPAAAGAVPLVWRQPHFSSVSLDPEVRHEALGTARDSIRPSLLGLHPGSATGAPLRELPRSCREKKTRVALVLMPEGPDCHSWYPQGTWRQLQAWLDELSREFDAPVVNAREWCEEDDFVDSHHLLPQAGVRVTERIGREYLAPWLGRSAAQRKDAYEPRP